MAETAAQKNRRIRQEALRQQLSEQCRVQHVLENIERIESLDPSSETFHNEVTKYKTSNDIRLRLISKYLPDLKQTELIGDPDQPVEHNHTVEFFGVNADSDSGKD